MLIVGAMLERMSSSVKMTVGSESGSVAVNSRSSRIGGSDVGFGEVLLGEVGNDGSVVCGLIRVLGCR